MVDILFLHFFTGHILADYYFQTSTMAKEKETTFRYLLLHCLIYLVTMIIVILPLFNWQLFFGAFFIGLIHSFIDSCKALLNKYFEFNDLQNVLLYFTDQLLHILTILFVVTFIGLTQIDISYLLPLKELLMYFNVNLKEMLSWLVVLLLILQPSSITIRKVLDHFDPKTSDEGIANAGALIGVFERLLILLMLYANQYAAIGFVLTAKSIARYNKIAEDPKFAEYYLLGTLLSSLLVIASFTIIF
ncbi:DUF3307 domain-containing protein [Tetragenococcus osmophilus]|uniref:DUF3307 domain-containing protein n=1 Tax=Tetragenococcus osmophilus TaxID=526944 RepID=A0AA37XKJ6_9ENTE|nr:DUF3307 domain-containing protein [Tetragenococcus osmophilus]AYW48557.1 DUF3307 domain-containing protein [Tetragenococcus osmophilus]GMA54458.1 hypothetical protein GCM10025857_58150 [Alicyclobacillus contaminans]GMA71689.1 hypothetical protein GCM10025885_07380 [Tetragenococcus osmophilus]